MTLPMTVVIIVVVIVIVIIIVTVALRQTETEKNREENLVDDLQRLFDSDGRRGCDYETDNCADIVMHLCLQFDDHFISIVSKY